MGKIKLGVFIPYAIADPRKAPSIRAINMVSSLKKIVDIEVITTLEAYPLFNSINFDIPFIKILEKPLRISSEIRSIVMNNDIDAMYIEAMGTCLYAFDYWFLNKKMAQDVPLFPFIRDLYWLFPGELKPTFTIERWYRYMNREFNWYLKNSNAVFLPSSSMKAQVPFSNTYALPPAGDPRRCINKELPDNHNVVFTGGISKTTGIIQLLEAMSLVRKQHPDAKCTIVGKGDPEVIKKIMKTENVKFFGEVQFHEIPKILSEAYLTIIPRTQTTHNNFALPLKLFDYMSCSRPVVVTDCSEMATFVNENKIGVVSKDDTAEQMSKSMIYLMDNPSVAQQFANNAFDAIVNNHSWDCRAKELIEIISRNIY